MQSFEDFRTQRYFTALDGLRGISILLVLLHHVPPFASPLLSRLRENGRYGVAFFFVISGFLICTLLLRERRQNGHIQIGRFYARRALRLLPLYYVVLFVQAVLVMGLGQYSSANQQLFQEKLPSYIFYYSNWLETATQGPFFCAWSLAVEEQFYFGFGLLLLLAPSSWIVTIVSVALAAKFIVFHFLGNIDVHSATWRVVFSYQEPIIWGVLLAFALDNRRRYEQLRSLLHSSWVLGGIAVFAAILLATRSMRTASSWDSEFLYVVMTLIVAGLAMRRWTPLLSSGPFATLGQVSYGVYLLHMFVISSIKKLPFGSDPLVCFVATVAIVTPLALLVYRYLELPIINYYKRRFAPSPTDNRQGPVAHKTP